MISFLAGSLIFPTDWDTAALHTYSTMFRCHHSNGTTFLIVHYAGNTIKKDKYLYSCLNSHIYRHAKTPAIIFYSRLHPTAFMTSLRTLWKYILEGLSWSCLFCVPPLVLMCILVSLVSTVPHKPCNPLTSCTPALHPVFSTACIKVLILCSLCWFIVRASGSSSEVQEDG